MAMRSHVESMPGVKFNFSQVIQTRNDELISGINAQIRGQGLWRRPGQLRKLAENIRDAMSHFRGVEDLELSKSPAKSIWKSTPTGQDRALRIEHCGRA